MKSLLAAAFVLVLLAGTVAAQGPSKPFHIYAGGGVTMPSSPSEFKDLYKTGFHAYGALGMMVSPLIQLVGKVGYHDLHLDHAEWGDPDADGGTFTALTYGVDARVAVGAPAVPVKPFGFGGAGLANIKVSDIESTQNPVESVTETKFYYNFGAGVEFRASVAITMFVQVSYIGISAEDTFDETIGLIPISVGVKF